MGMAAQRNLMSDTSQMKQLIKASSTPVDAYAKLLGEKVIGFDRGQKRVVDALQVLFDYILTETFQIRGRGFFAKFRSKNTIPARCGTYVWGDVGRGKSMLVDMFYDLVPLPNKRRMHFHAFMRDVHARMYRLRKNKATRNLLEEVVDELSNEFHVLCLDELQVHDVTDAMVLSKLFRALFQKGVVVVVTSNRPPEDLYLNGIQRDQFLPFIELVRGHMDVELLDSSVDYRLEQLRSLKQVYFTPLGEFADKFLGDTFKSLTRGHGIKPVVLEIQGRQLQVNKAAGGVAWLSFSDLCEQPLGAGDYLEIASSFHTLLLQNIPKLSPEKRNEAKRFVTLIDALYEHKVKLVCSAEVGPDDLYPKGDGSFEFQRTVSRLQEMQSEPYRVSTHIR